MNSTRWLSKSCSGCTYPVLIISLPCISSMLSSMYSKSSLMVWECWLEYTCPCCRFSPYTARPRFSTHILSSMSFYCSSKVSKTWESSWNSLMRSLRQVSRASVGSSHTLSTSIFNICALHFLSLFMLIICFTHRSSTCLDCLCSLDRS